jgi:predicted O-methyltransferase YrrM
MQQDKEHEESKERFNKIKDTYKKRRSRLILSGKSQHPTSHGYWAASNPDHVFELFRKLKLDTYSHFLDLGSGDGIVTAIASIFTTATGIEIDAGLHKAAVDIRNRLDLTHELKSMDYLEEDLSKYDIIFINPDNYFYKLEKNIVEQFKGALVITDNIFRPLTLTPKRKVSVRGTSYSIFRLE